MSLGLPVEARKAPRQRRSRETVEVILAATARVLASDGYARASTNRIAEVAGVSVGSIYQYFPNKDALVLAVAEEHAAEMTRLLVQIADTVAEGDLGAAIRRFVEGMIAAHAIDPALHRALVQQVLHLGVDALHEAQEQVRALVVGLLAPYRERLGVADLEIAAFVLVATVESVIHSAVFEKPELLARPAFADELTRIVTRYLGVEAAAS